MIKISEHPVSEMYYKTVLDSWEKYNYKIKTFDAVTPKDLYKKNKLTFGLKKGFQGRSDRPFTLTEKAVWYSHFELWCKCVVNKKPMLIIEHDSKLTKELPDLSKEKHKFLSYIIRDWTKDKHKKHIAPGSGYYITHLTAMQLVAKAVSREIVQNSDGHLGAIMNVPKQIKLNDYAYIQQISIDGLNTIDHKNLNKNFVGLDYEETDIPSIHWQEV